jgi:uncharacterized membrane protein YraQ (UPF0718 family)
MKIPVYVVTGFLGAGKTSFLNTLLNMDNWQDIKILVIQFEGGEENFSCGHGKCASLGFSKKALDAGPEKIAFEIAACLQKAGDRPFQEIWIEWNGMTSFSVLQTLVLGMELRPLCEIRRVMHIANGETIENLLGKTGAPLVEQIAESDFAVLRNESAPEAKGRIRRIFKSLNPGIGFYGIEDYRDIFKQIFREKSRPVSILSMSVLLIIVLYLELRSVFLASALPFDPVVNSYLGVILQAIPFLIIGVLLSSAIQVFVPRSFIEKFFPKSFLWGMFTGILAGFCLPVCDCASIPVFRSLVRKGVPLPAAITFMCAAPVINPVVVISTWYAFSGDTRIVIGRLSLGILVSLVTGFCFVLFPPKDDVLTGGVFDSFACSCGCYAPGDFPSTPGGKAALFLRHSRAEFFDVGRYLVIGTFASSVFQVFGTGIFAARSNTVLSILVMMTAAFILSLCSSSDAVIARSLARQFPQSALMGFMVFGPIMDIKNILMLSSGFSKSFVTRLLITSFIVCFLAVYFIPLAGGSIRAG